MLTALLISESSELSAKVSASRFDTLKLSFMSELILLSHNEFEALSIKPNKYPIAMLIRMISSAINQVLPSPICNPCKTARLFDFKIPFEITLTARIFCDWVNLS